MRQFAGSGFRIWKLSREAKVIYTFFCALSLLAVASSIALYEDLVGPALRRGHTERVSRYYSPSPVVSEAAPEASAGSPAAAPGGPQIALADDADKLATFVENRRLMDAMAGEGLPGAYHIVGGADRDDVRLHDLLRLHQRSAFLIDMGHAAIGGGPRRGHARHRFFRDLAEFECLTHLLQVTPEKLRPQLFGEKPAAEAMVAEVEGQVVAFALYFTNFSTFLARPGLYLEDLYVQPAHRGNGIGAALLRHLGALAVARGYGRFEWSVLDWNADAIRFYERMGATVMPDWRICRITGPALAAFGDAA